MSPGFAGRKTDGRHAGETRAEAADLLGQLARELSTLVRRDVEVAASERLPTVRQASTALGAALLDEPAEHQVKALPAVAMQQVHKAEADAARADCTRAGGAGGPPRASLNALDLWRYKG